MTTFRYKALDAAGQERTGTAKGRTVTEVRYALQTKELMLTEIAVKKSVLDIQVTQPRITPTELMHLSHQLAAFIRAGIPILDAITELGEGADSRAVRQVMSEIASDLRSGASLTESFDRHPKDFPTFYRGILKSAELTGQLDVVLDQLAMYLERDMEARRKIKSAMVYPAVVAVMAVGTVVILTFFVLPKFEVFFANLDAQLPLPTRMLLAFSAFIQSWWPVIAGLLLLAGVAYVVGVRTPRGRLLRDRTMLRIPAVGETLRASLIERFSRILASMVGAGVPLPEAMTVATKSLNNRAFELPLEQARAAMLDGAGLTEPIAATRLFPSMAIQMLRVGEETGSLDTQLEVAASFYSRELDYKVKRLATLVEPAVIVVMGSIVGFVAIALVSAMYGIFRSTSLV